MPNHAYRAASAPSVVQRARNTRTGRKLERGGYLTVETVTMWIVYAPVSYTHLGAAVCGHMRYWHSQYKSAKMARNQTIDSARIEASMSFEKFTDKARKVLVLSLIHI